jgi:hypothetical protein
MNNLLDEIKSAFAAVSEAETANKAARDEHISRAKALGLLLLDAHSASPADVRAPAAIPTRPKPKPKGARDDDGSRS